VEVVTTCAGTIRRITTYRGGRVVDEPSIDDVINERMGFDLEKDTAVSRDEFFKAVERGDQEFAQWLQIGIQGNEFKAFAVMFSLLLEALAPWAENVETQLAELAGIAEDLEGEVSAVRAENEGSAKVSDVDERIKKLRAELARESGDEGFLKNFRNAAGTAAGTAVGNAGAFAIGTTLATFGINAFGPMS
jgi:hypothetical protein